MVNGKRWLEGVPLDWSNARHRALRDLLASNVYAEDDIRRYAREAGLPVANIKFGGSATNNWYHVLQRADAMGLVQALVDHVAAQEGPEFARRVNELAADIEEIDEKNGRLPPDAWNVPRPVEPDELERVFGKGNFIDVGFLQLGLRRARSVARVTAHFRHGGEHGTGFLIGPDLVLTNHHVVYSEGAPADTIEVLFDYENKLDGSTPALLTMSGIADAVRSDQQDDWAVIPLSRPVPAGYEALMLSANVPIAAKDRVYIVQHPAGGPKKLGIHNNLVRYADERFIQYFTDTMPGSSGAPVFDRLWQVVGLHHASTSVKLPNGRSELRNQAVRIGLVIDGLKKSGVKV